MLSVFLALQSCNDNDRERSPVKSKRNTTPKKTKHRIALLPFNGVDTYLVSKIRKGVENKLNVLVTVLDPIHLPDHAFYKPRQRYIADSLLVFLEEVNAQRYEKIIGLTTKDISTRKKAYENWGVLGLGYCPGKACIVSTFRAGKKKVSPKDFERRMVTLSLHELGHTYGLEHCAVSDCLMKDAQGKMALDDGDSYCENCSYYLRLKLLLK